MFNIANPWATVRDDLTRIHQYIRSGEKPSSSLTELEVMIVVLEDRRYFTHSGIDIRSIIREAVRALTFQKHGGASTIEMQFVRTVTGYRHLTIRRKLYEMLLAILVQSRYSKLEILRSYMACAFFGSHVIGARAAAKTVFGKEVDHLLAEEAAFVAAMLARPRPSSRPPAWQSKVQRRAEYGLQVRASMRSYARNRVNTRQVPAALLGGRAETRLFHAKTTEAPPPDDTEHPVRIADGKAIGPDGVVFARTVCGGFVTQGATPLVEWLADNPPMPSMTASAVRVVQAVSMNEGRFEAVNSYDNSFLSFGIFQWSAGAGESAGELAGLLDMIRRSDEAKFDAYFGRYGLGATLQPGESDWPRIGFLSVSGRALRATDEKQQLRTVQWAYRFWRAGHDDIVRRCQLALAVSRIRLFYARHIKHGALADFITSEYGVALLLDQHVNRPAHVVETLERAIARLPHHITSLEPSKWSEQHELALISSYVRERDETNMIASADRSKRILDCVGNGSLSDRRGSFALLSTDVV